MIKLTAKKLKITVTTKENDTSVSFFTGTVDEAKKEIDDRNYDSEFKVNVYDDVFDEDGEVVDINIVASKINGKWVI